MNRFVSMSTQNSKGVNGEQNTSMVTGNNIHLLTLHRKHGICLRYKFRKLIWHQHNLLFDLSPSLSFPTFTILVPMHCCGLFFLSTAERFLRSCRAVHYFVYQFSLRQSRDSVVD